MVEGNSTITKTVSAILTAIPGKQPITPWPENFDPQYQHAQHFPMAIVPDRLN
jgi:hypothetical protein